MEKQIVDITYNFFISSNAYNGIPLAGLVEEAEIHYLKLIDTVIGLVRAGVLSIQAGVNPHIILLGHYDVDCQIQLLENQKSERDSLCIYPSTQYLRDHRDVSNFSTRPFECELALGEAQLTPKFFELDVLRRYDEPRYELKLEDYSGSIYAVDEKLKEKDKIFLQTFGLGVDENEERVVVVYLRYLAHLSPEHQKFWESKQIDSKCRVIEEYYENTILGNFTSSCSIFSAFLNEQKAVNQLTIAIYGKQLFSKTFEGDSNRPNGFHLLFLPTLKYFEDFISDLDKMISENINKDFFKGVIDLSTIETNKQGEHIKRDKGTLQLLEGWLKNVFHPNDDFDVFAQIFPAFKKIRKLRQAPAHKLSQDVYDKNHMVEQRSIMHDAYIAMMYLRKIFQLHKDGQNIILPEYLDKCIVKPF